MKQGDYRITIDKKSQKHRRQIWHACVDCGKERWVYLLHGEPASLKCGSCAASRRYGEANPQWKGGIRHDKKGYIMIKLYPDNFFYPMADKGHFVLEHRLVMAQSLGRCLHPWEVVHHRNGIKNDNRIGNLQLVGDMQHRQTVAYEVIIRKLKKENEMLKEEVTKLRSSSNTRRQRLAGKRTS